MSFLADNLAPLFVAIVASVMAWLFGGARGGWLVPVVPWFSFIMLEVIFCFPQRQPGENTFEARSGVREPDSIRSDSTFGRGFPPL